MDVWAAQLNGLTRGWGQAVAAHDFGEGGGIGWGSGLGCGFEDGGDLAEVGWAQDISLL